MTNIASRVRIRTDWSFKVTRRDSLQRKKSGECRVGNVYVISILTLHLVTDDGNLVSVISFPAFIRQNSTYDLLSCNEFFKSQGARTIFNTVLPLIRGTNGYLLFRVHYIERGQGQVRMGTRYSVIAPAKHSFLTWLKNGLHVEKL